MAESIDDLPVGMLKRIDRMRGCSTRLEAVKTMLEEPLAGADEKPPENTSPPDPLPGRSELIKLCEDGIVFQTRWHNRDSAQSQIKLGQAWALLKAGCTFDYSTDPESDHRTLWINIEYEGFQTFELGVGHEDTDLFYIPTRKRLEEAGDGDWY